jgi:hypothetical protein
MQPLVLTYFSTKISAGGREKMSEIRRLFESLHHVKALQFESAGIIIDFVPGKNKYLISFVDSKIIIYLHFAREHTVCGLETPPKASLYRKPLSSLSWN